MSQLKRICDFLFHANVIKTIIFNFKMLPKKQAVRLPIWLYGRLQLKFGIHGHIIYDSKRNHFGSWQIGYQCLYGYGQSSKEWTYVNIYGTMIIGEHGSIGNGSNIEIRERGKLVIGDNVTIKGNSKICCEDLIIIGDNTRISWECQILDTDFHYYVNQEGRIKRKSSSIEIGKDCWIGNRCSINKGAKLGTSAIVASNSVVTKNFLMIDGAMVAGIPAKVVSQGNRHIWSWEEQREIDNKFEQNKDVKCVFE